MKFNFNVSPNLRQKQSTRRIMAELTIALLVVYAFSLYFYYTRYDLDRALQAVKLMAVSLLVAFATESIWALVTKQKVGAVSYTHLSIADKMDDWLKEAGRKEEI